MHRLTCGISFLFRSVNLILFTLLLVHLPTLRITGEVIFTYKQDKKDDRSRKSENFTSRRGSVLLRSHLAPTSNGLGSDLSTCSQMLRQTMTNRWCCNLLMYLMTTASARKMTHTNKTNYTQWFVTLFTTSHKQAAIAICTSSADRQVGVCSSLVAAAGMLTPKNRPNSDTDLFSVGS